MNTPEYMEPTPAGRLKIVASFCALAALGLVWHYFLFPPLRAHVKALPACDQFTVLSHALLAMVTVLPLAVCAFGGWVAHQLLKHERFPLPNAWVWQRTRVRRGFWVKARACAILLLCGLALCVVGWMWRLVGAMTPPKDCLTASAPRVPIHAVTPAQPSLPRPSPPA